MKTVILFNTNPLTIGKTMPLALLSISAPIANSYDVAIVEFKKDKRHLLEIKNLIEQKDVILFGVTAITGTPIAQALEVSKLVKTMNNFIPVVWGGYHASLLPEQTLQNAYIDYVVAGQGEETFLKLLQKLENNDNCGLDEIEGLYFKRNGNIYGRQRVGLVDLNSFPRLPFHLVNIDDFVSKNESGIRSIAYVTSQGCYAKCGFCSESPMYKSRWKGLSPERVVDDWLFLSRKHNIDHIHIVDIVKSI